MHIYSTAHLLLLYCQFYCLFYSHSTTILLHILLLIARSSAWMYASMYLQVAWNHQIRRRWSLAVVIRMTMLLTSLKEVGHGHMTVHVINHFTIKRFSPGSPLREVSFAVLHSTLRLQGAIKPFLSHANQTAIPSWFPAQSVSQWMISQTFLCELRLWPTSSAFHYQLSCPTAD